MLNSNQQIQIPPQMLSQMQDGRQQTFNAADNQRIKVDTSAYNVGSKAENAVKNPWTSTALWFASWFGLIKASDIFNKYTGGNYEDSMAGKIGAFGDKVAKTKAWGFLDKYVAQPFIKGKNCVSGWMDKTQVTRALKMRVSGGAWTSKNVVIGYISEVADDAHDVLEDLYLKDRKIPGVSKEELGNFITKVNMEPHKYLNELQDMMRKVPDDVYFVGKLPWKWAQRKVRPQEIINKLEVVRGTGCKYRINETGAEVIIKANSKHVSKLGQSLPKFAYKTFEGLTNGTAGGYVAIALQAKTLADATYRAWKAPWGEKWSAFSEEVFTDITNYMMMPFTAGFLIQHLGGLKYTGLDENGRINYLKELHKFNKKAEAGMSVADYKAGKKELKKMLNGDCKWYNKPIKWAAMAFDVGLERIKPNNLKDGKKFHFANFLDGTKAFMGFPMRFLPYMILILPFFQKPIVKIIHWLFGTPSDSDYAERYDSKEKAKKQPQPMPQQVMQQQGLNPVQQAVLFAPANSTEKAFSPEQIQALKQRGLTPQEIQQLSLVKLELDKQKAKMANHPALQAFSREEIIAMFQQGYTEQQITQMALEKLEYNRQNGIPNRNSVQQNAQPVQQAYQQQNMQPQMMQNVQPQQQMPQQNISAQTLIPQQPIQAQTLNYQQQAYQQPIQQQNIPAEALNVNMQIPARDLRNPNPQYRRSYIPNPVSKIQHLGKEAPRNYLPNPRTSISPLAANTTGNPAYDAKIQKALHKANDAERDAMEILGKNRF